MSRARCWLPFVALALVVGCAEKNPKDVSTDDDRPSKEGVRTGGEKPKPKEEKPSGDRKPPDDLTKGKPKQQKTRQKFDAAAKYEKRYSEARASKMQTPEMDRAMKRIAREASTDGASEYVCKCVEGLSAREQDDCAEECINTMIRLGFDDDARKVLNHVDEKPRRLRAESAIAAASKAMPGIVRAAKAKDRRVVLVMLDRGYAADVRGPDEETALMYAAQDGDVEMARGLIEAGANVNAKRKLGVGVLTFAASNNRKEVAELLLDRGAEIEGRDEQGLTPLHAAARAGGVEAAALLLDRKADVNARNKAGATPLHLAAFEEKVDAMKLLLDRRADINAKTTDGKATPLKVAIQAKHPAAVKVLLERKADVDYDASALAETAFRGENREVYNAVYAAYSKQAEERSKEEERLKKLKDKDKK
jgi:ankyrin repeat protein